ncbi:LacI family DNA-binding transcriptional regulator, partial [Escherichia coli]|nr:LacI family DNA-binding transcriptional regulator [Escherichia coli]
MSLKAIATALGVSVTTVSRALGGYADVSVSTPCRGGEGGRRPGFRPLSQRERDQTRKKQPLRLCVSA